jgi:Ala-tRNA(Pro) deacylase
MAATALTDALVRHEIEYELIPHPHTETAVAEARALGMLPDYTAKTVIVRTEDGFTRAVVPASRRVDLERLAEVLGAENAAIATESELAGAYPAFELGAVPPFDGAYADPVVIDIHLAGAPTVVFEAGTHEESVLMRTEDLIDASEAQLASICEPLSLSA